MSYTFVNEESPVQDPVSSPVEMPVQSPNDSPTAIGNEESNAPSIPTIADASASPSLSNVTVEDVGLDDFRTEIDNSPLQARGELAVLEAPNFKISYNTEGSITPLRSHYIELKQLTEEFLELQIGEIASSSNLISMTTDFVTSMVTSEGPITVEFSSSAYFDTSYPVPTQGSMNEMISEALTGYNADEYLLQLSMMDDENVFSTTTTTAFNDEYVSQSEETEDAEKDKLIIIGASLGVLALTLAMCIARKRGQCCNRHEEFLGKSDETHMDMTVAETLASGSSSKREHTGHQHLNFVADDIDANSVESSHVNGDWNTTSSSDASTDHLSNESCCDSSVYTRVSGYTRTSTEHEDEGEHKRVSIVAQATRSFESLTSSPAVRFVLDSFEKAWREDAIASVSGKSIHSQDISERWDGLKRRQNYPWGVAPRKGSKNIAPGESEEKDQQTTASLSISRDVKTDLEDAGLLSYDETEDTELENSYFEEHHSDTEIESQTQATKPWTTQENGSSVHQDCQMNSEMKAPTLTPESDVHDVPFDMKRGERTAIEEELVNARERARQAEAAKEAEKHKATEWKIAYHNVQENCGKLKGQTELELRRIREAAEQNVRQEAEKRRQLKDQFEEEKKRLALKLETSELDSFHPMYPSDRQDSLADVKGMIVKDKAEEARRTARSVLETAKRVEEKRKSLERKRIHSRNSFQKLLKREGSIREEEERRLRTVRTTFESEVKENLDSLEDDRASSSTEEQSSGGEKTQSERLGFEQPFDDNESLSSFQNTRPWKSGFEIKRETQTDESILQNVQLVKHQEFIAPWRDIPDDISSNDATLSSIDGGTEDTTKCDSPRGAEEAAYRTVKTMNKLKAGTHEPWWYADEHSMTRRNRTSFRRSHYSRIGKTTLEDEDSECTSHEASSHGDRLSESSGFTDILPR